MKKVIGLSWAVLFCWPCLQASAAVPDAPQNPAATPGNAALSLVWTPPAGTVTQYYVYSGLTYTALSVPTLTTTAPWAVLSGLQNGSIYEVAVSAVNADGEGAKTSAILAVPAVFPQAPAGVTAAAVFASGWQVRLEWQAAVQGTTPVAGYRLYRSQNIQSQTTYAFSSGTIYTDAAVNTFSASALYYYWVAAVDQLGNTGAVSSPAAVNIYDPGAPPEPGYFIAGAKSGQVDLQWNSGTAIADGYNVYYHKDLDADTLLAFPGNTNVCSVALPNNGETYYFSLAGIKNGIIGRRSQITCRTLPPQVTGLTSFSGNGYFQFSWNPAPAAAGVINYHLFGEGNTLTTTSATNAITTAVHAYYAVSAVNESGEGEGSNTVAASAPVSVPAPPRNFTVAVGLSRTLDFTWDKNPTDDEVTAYILHAADGPSTEWVIPPTSDSLVNTQVANFVNGQSCRFYLTAQNSLGGSAASLTLTAIPLAAPASENIQAVQKNNALAITWAENEQPSGVDGYDLYSSTAAGDSLLTQTTETFYLHNGLAAGTYAYHLFARNALGQGTTVTATGTINEPPPPPSNLQFLAGDRQAQIIWKAVTINAPTSYNLYRRPTQTLYYEFVKSVQSNINSVTDSNLTNKVKYYYAVSANNSDGEGLRSTEMAVIPYRSASPPGSPRFNQLRKSIRLEWDAAVAGDYPVIGYNIYRSVNSGTFVLLASAQGTSPTVEARTNTIPVFAWDDEGDYGNRYTYRLHAVDEDSENQIWHEGLAYPIVSVRIDQPQNRLEVYRNAFNPAKGGSVPIQLMQVQSGRAWIKIYNLAGEHVRTLFDQDIGPGFDPLNPFIVFLSWDGKNNNGEIVACGVYLIHAEGQSQYHQTRKVAIIK